MPFHSRHFHAGLERSEPWPSPELLGCVRDDRSAETSALDGTAGRAFKRQISVNRTGMENN